uniref:SCP domain-containing protein n=1 Tax=Strongyloides venezuelensis TaxID=75913 RepID=A0A0K0EZW1_STRVS
MNFYSKTFLTVSIFLAILFIGCQANENKESGDEGASYNLKLNDVPYFSRNNGEDGSKFSLMSGYVENKDQQKRDVKSSSAKSKTSRKVSYKKSKTAHSQYIKMKYKLYNDINQLRVKNSLPKLKVDVKLSKELQKYVVGLVKKDFTHKYRKLQPEDMFYIVKKNENYDPLGYWSKDLEYFKPKDEPYYRLPFLKLFLKSSTHMGCGVAGGNNSRGGFRIVVYCRIRPLGNVQKEVGTKVLIY